MLETVCQRWTNHFTICEGAEDARTVRKGKAQTRSAQGREQHHACSPNAAYLAYAAQKMAEAYLTLGDLERAERALEIVLPINESVTEPDDRRVLGEIWLRRGRMAEARDHVERSLDEAWQKRDRLLTAYARRAQAKIYLALDDEQLGRKAILAACALFEGFKGGQKMCSGSGAFGGWGDLRG